MLILILILALFLRVWHLNVVPVSVFGDEIDVGLQANSLLQTGKDYYSNSWPLMPHSFSEYRLPVLIYSAIPFVSIFGLNEWGVRLPAVFYGLLSLLGFYFLTKELINNKVALIAMILMSISPWHLQFSRQGGVEGVVALAFIVWAAWLFLMGIKKYYYLILSMVVFALSFYTYAINNLFTPLTIVGLVIIYRKKIIKFGWKKITIVLTVGLVILLPFVNLYFRGLAPMRFSQISIFANKDIKEEVIRRKAEFNSIITPLFQNQKVALITAISRNYLEAFSPEFLFIRGDPNLRNSIGGFGEFYFFETITILLGLIFLIKNFKRDYMLFFGWLLIAPIPAVLTSEGGNHAGRLILVLVPIIIISSLGINYLLSLKGNKWKILTAIILMVSLANISSYFYRYYVEWPKDSWRFWQSGYKELMNVIKQNDYKYSKVFFNNTYEPTLPRFLFWTNYDIALFQKQFTLDQPRSEIAAGFDGFKLGDKYYFGIFKKPIEKNIKPGNLYVYSARDDVTNPKILEGYNVETIYSPKKDPIFYIVETK